MLIRMLRTQTTAIGTFRCGVSYRLDMNLRGQKDCAEDLLQRKMAEEVTAEQLEAEKVEAEEVAAKQLNAEKSDEQEGTAEQPDTEKVTKAQSKETPDKSKQKASD